MVEKRTAMEIQVSFRVSAAEAMRTVEFCFLPVCFR